MFRQFMVILVMLTVAFMLMGHSMFGDVLQYVIFLVFPAPPNCVH